MPEAGLEDIPEAPAVEFSEASFAYDGIAHALEGISLSVGRGEFVAVLGANGSGKSTLAKHVNALLTPTSGTVRVLGLDTADPSNLTGIRTSTGLVMQDPDSQIVATVVADDVAFGPENLGLGREEIGRRIDSALAAVDLEGLAGASAEMLSGGQKQRLAIAGALAMEPEILVLDEPFAMLDPQGRDEAMSIIRQLADGGVTVILVTHSPEDAMAAERVVVLRQGRVAAGGTPAEVLADGAILAEMSLGQPFAMRMAGMLEDRGVKLGGIPTDIGELADMIRTAVKRPGTKTAAGRNGTAGTEADAPEGDSGAGKGAECRSVASPTAEHAGFGTEAIPAADGPLQRNSICIDRLSCSYDANGREVCALSEVSVVFGRTDISCVIGRTGSGKSTLLLHINGIIEAQSGGVTVDGRALRTARDRAEVRRMVGMALQFPERQLFAQTVFDDVAFAPRNFGLAEARIADRVRWALEAVGLDPDVVSRLSPFSLSGGQQRRVALAGAIASLPSYLVLDEPTSGLDPAGAEEILDLISRLASEGIGIVMATHDMDAVARLATRVVVLDGGRVAAQGAPGEIFSDAELVESLGLKLPHAMQLAAHCRVRGIELPDAAGEADLADAIAAMAEGGAR